MLEINWNQDYQGEFTCPKCNKSQLRLCGHSRKERKFRCPQCNYHPKILCHLPSRYIHITPLSSGEIIDWKKEYKDDFTCPKCSDSQLRLSGLNKAGKRVFRCPQCKKTTSTSLNLYTDSYLRSKPVKKEKNIDWNKDYKDEFICPKCNAGTLTPGHIDISVNKRLFYCPNCRKSSRESCSINIQATDDPIYKGTTWYSNHRIKGFICPNCQAEDIYFIAIQRDKKRFRCRTCNVLQYDSLFLNKENLSRCSEAISQVTPFNWDSYEWDLRSINPNFDERDHKYFSAIFTNIDKDWFKQKVKKYVHYLCKSGSKFGTIQAHLSELRNFSRYLTETKIDEFTEINRNTILDYLSQKQKRNRLKIAGLRKFFEIGNIKCWFNIAQDIIRNEDYPKRNESNPDPISDLVREKIEQNLQKLPKPIARMWLICYFCAMRPSELALLKQDCLVQEGQHWKLIWQRKKTNDHHEIPISRTIAKIVQEQQEYIKDLWGNDWNFLFCHYRNLSSMGQFNLKLEPVKKVIPNEKNNPLSRGINILIKTLDIRDENGQLAKFQPKLLRSTRATKLFDQGHDLAVVSAWLGHKHLVTTSTYYTQVSCGLMRKEAGHIQQVLVNSNGCGVLYESFPKSFWENPVAHTLELADTHINTPIYGYCGLPLDQDCHKFRACYTCESFAATIEKLSEYINTRNELKSKLDKVMLAGHEVLFEQFSKQAEQLDKIIASLQQEAV